MASNCGQVRPPGPEMN